jgi:iron complex transport system ATP-binding protein
MTIQADRLTVTRLGRPVLRGVSVRIADGDVVSIIGPNGAGKSTLMAALLGLLPAAEGAVRLDGRPIESLPRRQVARRIAYVPQLHEGYLGFTVREVVEGGRYAYLDPLDPLSAEDHAIVESAAEAAGVNHLLERPVDTLSGGERQKVWIAAALAQRSPILFLDEPTNALDPAHQVELIRIMREFMTDSRSAATGRNTLLLVSHDLNLPLAIGGRVLALREGVVALDEPVEALLDTNRLEALFGTSFVLYHGPGGRVSVHVQV